MHRALFVIAAASAHSAAHGANSVKSTAPWQPVPPCAAPAGISAPAVAESMCSRDLAVRGDVTVREMGLPANETLIASAFFAPDWPVVVGYAVSSVIDYFLGDNAPSKKIPAARTTPFTLRQRHFPNGTVYEWTGSMMVSTVVFPSASSIPAPVIPDRLEPVASRLVAVRQFNTTTVPSELDFVTACAGISPETLPSGYTIDATSHWSPTLAIYSGQESALFENECWFEVIVT